MAFTVAQIAEALEARFEGDGSLSVTAASEPATASSEAIALAMDPKYSDGLTQGDAKAAILWDGADWKTLGLEAAIFVPRPRYAMSGLTHLMDQGPDIEPGIHPTAIVNETARLGSDIAIGPFVVIGRDVEIGTGARIASHVSIAEGARIGTDALIHAGVRIGHSVKIGDRFICQPGAVIGADGFSFVTPETSAVENARKSLGDTGDAQAQSWTRIHSLGAVSIGDDVEIGANATIDRGTIRNTVVGDGTKLDNLVHLGHNVEVGRDCLLCGQVGVAGSAKIGDRVVLGGQCGVSDNIFVGDGVIAGGSTKIFTNAPAGRVLLGSPAVKMETHVEMQKAMRRLPRFMKQVQDRLKG
ncbi:MAG: UDP-3-O-(3-hydroxymyristoyl)glucosamine N-acyltransferase [Litoreibacter sp.]|nr:UDP-3-O-(3-hydroxymyristoyl)glucosamine N-acyltransferase [Litoreibacter sp.]